MINPNETTRNWQTGKREAAVQLYLSGVEGDSAELVNARIAGFTLRLNGISRSAGFPLSLNVIPVPAWIAPEELSAATAAVIQVDADTPASVKRFQKLLQ